MCAEHPNPSSRLCIIEASARRFTGAFWMVLHLWWFCTRRDDAVTTVSYIGAGAAARRHRQRSAGPNSAAPPSPERNRESAHYVVSASACPADLRP
ncbi:hypothetical protein EVAR_6738_1 [Eumeta japonica]|uniref:Uncharacterized protein n=1 Tax=Eumeta variegata TaxID=151549 RepID=A0A4C1V4F7_EUMVA|nr:hypothetical protein EVAR_6738_1 [Eumeta japonica]